VIKICRKWLKKYMKLNLIHLNVVYTDHLIEGYVIELCL